MRKYLLLLLLTCSIGNAQYNLFARQNFAHKAVSNGTNTEIGGVASTISTPALLASKLGISVGSISNFAIVGSDIKCKITGSYAMPISCWEGSPITYYRDNDNLVTSLSLYSFRATSNLSKIEFNGVVTCGGYQTSYSQIGDVILPNCTVINDYAFFDTYNYANEKKIVIPRCTTLGSSVLSNNVFNQGIGNKTIIYAHPSLATNNAGAPDGDIAYAISAGATVRYVTNFTAPSPITDLSEGTIHDTSIQLTFTAPSSTNAVDYYECYANGVFKNKITYSGDFINDLTQNTNYSISVYAVDVFKNKSLISNIVNQTTSNTGTLSLQEKTVASYHLSDGIESKRRYDGYIGSAITFVSGAGGNGANFNAGSNAFISVQDDVNFSFTNGTTDTPFSINFNLKLTSNGTQFLISKASGGFSSNAAEWSMYNSSGSIIVLFANKTTGYLASQFASSLTTGVWYNITMTYSGSGTNAGIKLYVNNVSKTQSSINSGTYTSMSNTLSTVNFGQEKAGAGSFILNGILDEITIFKYELNATEVGNIHDGGTPIFYPF